MIYTEPHESRVTRVTHGDIGARWLRIEAMPADEYTAIAARVGVCAECLGPALYSEADLKHTIGDAICSRCGKQFTMPLEVAS